jgi:hypothetical protein
MLPWLIRVLFAVMRFQRGEAEWEEEADDRRSRIEGKQESFLLSIEREVIIYLLIWKYLY